MKEKEKNKRSKMGQNVSPADFSNQPRTKKIRKRRRKKKDWATLTFSLLSIQRRKSRPTCPAFPFSPSQLCSRPSAFSFASQLAWAFRHMAHLFSSCSVWVLIQQPKSSVSCQPLPTQIGPSNTQGPPATDQASLFSSLVTCEENSSNWQQIDGRSWV